MEDAFVGTNLLDLWSEPRFNSERASQLLFGELVRTGATRLGFVRVVQPDGYAGWVDRRFLKAAPHRLSAGFRKAAEYVVTREKAAVLKEAEGGSESPHFLFYGTRVRVVSRRDGQANCICPDGNHIRIKATFLAPVPTGKSSGVTGAALARETRRFLGVPYLWGGVSPAGFDCSGLVQTVLGRFGIDMPRDTKDQIKVGQPIERDAVRTGDLLFFKRHVGIAIGRDRLIHASMGGSGVRINSLGPGRQDYRPDLDRDFASARRIL